MSKSKSARYRPLARLGRLFKHKSVRCIEPDGPQQLHLGSSCDRIGLTDRSTTATFPARNGLSPGCDGVRHLLGHRTFQCNKYILSRKFRPAAARGWKTAQVTRNGERGS